MNHLKLTRPVVDKILGLNTVFKKDNNVNKINLIIGAYRTREGLPYKFNSVIAAEEKVFNMNHEYLPMEGDIEFLSLAKKIYFNNNSSQYDSVQTLSGTGSLKLAGEFLGLYHCNKNIHIPNPTWSNHENIFKNCGLNVKEYMYLDKKRSFNFEQIIDSIKQIPNNEIILLHACAHNPSGYDFDKLQWKEIISTCIKQNLFILIDFAYLGFASGNPDKDNYITSYLGQYFTYPSIICCSFAKNFGLYSSRVGTLFFCGKNNEETELIKENCKSIIRRTYSNPPSHGSNLIKTILSDVNLTDMWKSELLLINEHYNENRLLLQNKLETKLNQDFSDITKQKGMFYYSKLSTEQVLKMKEKGIYFPDDGRISIGGINVNNIDYIVDQWY